MAEYSWADGRWPAELAQTLGELVAEISSGNGGICTTDDVIAVAVDPAHPLHVLFQWDDTSAAHAYRQYQARNHIRRVRVEEYPNDAPAFVSVRVELGQGYKQLHEVEADEVLYAQAIRSIAVQLKGLRRRYQKVREFKAVWEAIDELDT